MRRSDRKAGPTARAGPLRALLAAAAMATAVHDGAACGFEDPRSVSLGVLNWAYPEALRVRTAVWQAEDAGLLPPRDGPAATGPFAFYRAARTMEKLGALLDRLPDAGAGLDISVVLIPAVMWTRYSTRSGGMDVETHVSGPEKGDIVVVTDEKVVRALLAGKFDLDQAVKRELMRFYGGYEDQVVARAMFRDALRPATHAGRIERGKP